MSRNMTQRGGNHKWDKEKRIREYMWYESRSKLLRGRGHQHIVGRRTEEVSRAGIERTKYI